jgi:hypothetical protein
MQYVKAGATLKEVMRLAGRVVTVNGVHFLCQGLFNAAMSSITLTPLSSGETVARDRNGVYEPVSTNLEAQGWRWEEEQSNPT